MQRRDFLGAFVLGAVALAAALHSATAAEPSARPNIIYILADDLGFGHLGCYGNQEILTPNIDGMAAEGMRFTNHYAGSAVCAPSRCVLITGLHSGHCFVRGNRKLPVEGNVPIPADSQTVGKVMREAGYATAAVGKWGLGYPGSEGDPNNQGFDHFFGYNCQRQAHNYYPDHLWRNQKKVILAGNRGGQQKDYSHDLLTQEALGWIRRNRRRPFLLYLPYTIPHARFQVPDLGVYADKPWGDQKKAIAAMITRMDRDVGRVLALLKELGIEGNTLVTFASDNGCAGGALLKEFNGSGALRDQKGTLYEGGLRVPMIARWPGKIAAGSKTDLISGFQDILPTCAELAGATPPKRTDGISMVPTLLGQGEQTLHPHLYWEHSNQIAVRMGDWKAVQTKGDTELFNLRDDVSEKNDVADEHPEIVERLERIMKAEHEQTPWTNWRYGGP